MKYNGGKFQILNFGNNEELKEYVLFTEEMEDVINEHDTVKDLGILIDAEASVATEDVPCREVN